MTSQFCGLIFAVDQPLIFEINLRAYANFNDPPKLKYWKRFCYNSAAER